MSATSRKKLKFILAAVGTALFYISSFFSPAAGKIIRGAGDAVSSIGNQIEDNSAE